MGGVFQLFVGKDVEVDSSAILDLFGSNQFLSCLTLMSFF